MKISRFILTIITYCSSVTFSCAQEQPAYYYEIPYEEINGKLIIDANVDGIQGKYVFDTGAPFYISSAVYKKIATDEKTEQKNVVDASGKKVEVQSVPVKNIGIGTKNLLNIEGAIANIIPAGNMIETFGVDGIIGSNFFPSSVVRFDSKAKKIIITDKVDVFKISPRCRVKMDNYNGQNIPFIKANLGNGVMDEPMFDSGSSSFFELNENVALGGVIPEKAGEVLSDGFGGNDVGLGGKADNIKLKRIKLNDLRLGMGKFKNVVTNTMRGPGSRFGSSILKYGIATIDNANHVFYYEPFDSNPIDLYEKHWNLDFSVNEQGDLIVGTIWDYNPFIAHDIELGDQVISVNGKPLGKINLQEALRGNMLKLEGDYAIITIKKKDGSLKAINMYKK